MQWSKNGNSQEIPGSQNVNVHSKVNTVNWIALFRFREGVLPINDPDHRRARIQNLPVTSKETLSQIPSDFRSNRGGLRKSLPLIREDQFSRDAFLSIVGKPELK